MFTKQTITRQTINDLAKVCPEILVSSHKSCGIYGRGNGSYSNPYTNVEHQARVLSGLCTDGCQCYYYDQNGEVVSDLGTVTVTGTPISGCFGGVKASFVPAEGQGIPGSLLVTSGTYSIGGGVMEISMNSTQKQGYTISSWVEVYKDGYLVNTSSAAWNPSGYYYETGGPAPLGECSFALPTGGMVKVVVVVSMVYTEGSGRAAVNYSETIYEHQR